MNAEELMYYSHTKQEREKEKENTERSVPGDKCDFLGSVGSPSLGFSQGERKRGSRAHPEEDNPGSRGPAARHCIPRLAPCRPWSPKLANPLAAPGLPLRGPAGQAEWWSWGRGEGGCPKRAGPSQGRSHKHVREHSIPPASQTFP